MQNEQVGFVALNNESLELAMKMAQAMKPLGKLIYIHKNKTQTGCSLDELNKLNARVCETPRQLASCCSVVFSLVTDGCALESVAFGEDGLVAGMNEGCIHVDLSTLMPTVADKMVDAYNKIGCKFAVASIFGQSTGKTLVSMGGCDLQAQTRLKPLLDVFTTSTMTAGSNAKDAYVLKLVSDMFIASMMETLAEGMTLAEKAGLSRSTVLEYINHMFPAPIIQQCAERMARNEFEPTNGFDVQQGLRDMSNTLQLAHLYKVNMPVARIVHDHLEETVQQGRGNLDCGALVTVVREESGIAPLYRNRSPSTEKNSSSTSPRRVLHAESAAGNASN